MMAVPRWPKRKSWLDRVLPQRPVARLRTPDCCVTPPIGKLRAVVPPGHALTVGRFPAATVLPILLQRPPPGPPCGRRQAPLPPGRQKRPSAGWGKLFGAQVGPNVAIKWVQAGLANSLFCIRSVMTMRSTSSIAPDKTQTRIKTLDSVLRAAGTSILAALLWASAARSAPPLPPQNTPSKQESKLIKKCEKRRDLASCVAYLQAYPTGSFTYEALDYVWGPTARLGRFARTEDYEFFQGLCRIDHPRCTEVDELLSHRALSRNSGRSDLSAFLDEYPNSSHRTQVMQWLWDSLRRFESVDKYRWFLVCRFSRNGRASAPR